MIINFPMLTSLRKFVMALVTPWSDPRGVF